MFTELDLHGGVTYYVTNVIIIYLQVNGIARSYVFTGLDLHDGVTYYVTLISCNSAEICTTSTSQGMFVDSTPPSRGW